MKKIISSLLFAIFMCIATKASDVNITLQGLENDHCAVINIESATFLKTIEADHNGTYIVDAPVGTHTVKVEIFGYNLPEAKSVRVNEDGTVDPAVGIHLTITRKDEDPNVWNYSWHEDGSTAGAIESSSSNVVKPAEVEFLGKMIVPSDVPSAQILLNEYKMLLVDDEEKWTNEYAYRLLETMKTLPGSFSANRLAKVILTNDRLDRDVEIEDMGDEKFVVRITKDAFYYANPFLVTLDGVRGKFYSKRLHHAMTNFVTNFGEDRWHCDQILRERFGCSIYPPSYEELTQGITNENEYSFQEFVPSELVSIINMLEELPEGYHKTPHLNYLIRRQNGMKHPIHPQAAAVSWCVDNGYIEFMEIAFGSTNVAFETLRLILHEKTHFLWAFSLSDEIKNDWTEIGGWYKTADDEWATTKEVEFVTSYSHEHNPNEDLAESVAYYLKDPDKLLARSEAKYNFIRDRIMHGTRYISTIPDYLTFEVLNLFPDYDYPGKISGLDIEVLGAPEEDKTVHVTVHLNHVEGYKDGSSHGFVRILSPIFNDDNGKTQQHYIDIHLSPKGGDAWTLEGWGNINRYQKAGYWSATSIKIDDDAGNERFGNSDVIWNMYVNNPLEDFIAPEVQLNDLYYTVIPAVDDGDDVQILRAAVPATDNVGVRTVFMRLSQENVDYTLYGDNWGKYDEEKKEAYCEWTLTKHHPSGRYYITWCEVHDVAANVTGTFYSADPEAMVPRKYINIETSDPDYEAPEIDLNRISIFAQPTHPEAPDGETLVTINFYVRDDKSGVPNWAAGNFTLLDPQGNRFGDWYYLPELDTTKPTLWQKCQITKILPQGSAPGIWGLAEMSIVDNVGNWRTYNFVETLIFEPDDDTSNYILFADMDKDQTSLYFRFEQQEGLIRGIEYRVVNEDTGEEITGIIYEPSKLPRRGKACSNAPENNDFAGMIDVSSLPNGKLILIAKGLDAEGGVLCVKSAIVEKMTQIAGDVNFDQTCTMTDIALTAAYIMSSLDEQNEFNPESADMDMDGKVLVNDLTAIIDIVLEADNSNSDQIHEEANGVQDALLVFGMNEIQQGQTAIMNLALNSANEVRGFQFDLTLPDGLTPILSKIGDTDHDLSISNVGSNIWRVLSYSMQNTEYPADSPAVAVVSVFIPENYTVGSYSIAFNNVYLSNHDNRKIEVDDFSTSMNVISNAYTITYVVDGEDYYTEVLKVGDPITPIAEPEKEGHTFQGWSEIPETMPAQDITIEGTFSVNTYFVRYYDGETLLAEFEVEFGASIPEYQYDKEGYVFEYWEGEAFETMPAHDIAYYANTTPNCITDLVEIDDDAEISLYNLTGLVVYKGNKAGMPKGLKGLYIIILGDKILKLVL